MKRVANVVLLFAAAGLFACSGGRPPNLLLIVLDTVRADRIACEGGAASLTPHLDAFCERSIRFTHATSTSSWTLPAHASLFTGLYPITHGATQEHTRLEAGVATLAEILGERGYRTLGVSANPVVSINSGLARGFDAFEETWRARRAGGLPTPAEHPNRRAVDELLEFHPKQTPFFLFVNFIETHGPNTPPEPHRSRALSRDRDEASVRRAEHLSAREYYLDPTAISAEEFAIVNELYDGEISYLDALVGGLLDDLEAAGYLDDTVVVITADHGENLGDGGQFRHIFGLTPATVRVPLLIHLPGDGRGGEVRSEPVSLLDVFATLLARAGAPPRGEAGRDLLSTELPAAPMIAEYYFPQQALTLFARDMHPDPPAQLRPYLRRQRSIEIDGLRFVWSSDGRAALYDLAADPREEHDVLADPRFADEAARLRASLDDFVAQHGGATPLPSSPGGREGAVGVFEDLDAESARELRALGYLPD